MKIALFVHDCFLEIGHSHAMIEILRNIPNDKIESIEIISFTSEDPLVLFPEMPGKVHFKKVPFPNLYPVLFKIIFYHIWTFFYTKLFISKETKLIGIGIASLTARIINIQFIHSQWNDYFFKHKKMSLFTVIYKKVLFSYFLICEKFLFSRKDIKLGVLSNFVTEYCKDEFKLSDNQVKTVYSGINLKKYSIDETPRTELYQDLLKRYPQLKTIDPNRPIYLFVGAYERKGLPTVLEKLKEVESPQLIIVGSPDSFGEFHFPKHVTTAAVKFTKELPLFYSLADIFVFPTSYEPFGLVITEAVAMGMEVYITEKHVGATELLHDFEGVHICHTPKELNFSVPKLLSLEDKLRLRQSRIEKLSSYSWKKSGEDFYKLMV